MKNIFLILMLFPTFLKAQDSLKILETANEYVLGRNEGQPDRLNKAFLPTAELKGIDANTKAQKITSLAEYVSKQKTGVKHDCITTIRLIDYKKDLAIVNVLLTYKEYAFYDYLILLKVNDKWIIADKFYTRLNANEK